MGEKNINEHVLVRKPQFTLTPGALKNFICTGGSSPELGRVQSFTTEVAVVTVLLYKFAGCIQVYIKRYMACI